MRYVLVATILLFFSVGFLLSCTTFETDPVTGRFNDNFSGEIAPVADIDPVGTNNFKFVVLSDTHMGSPGGNVLESMLARIQSNGDAFVISCGDNTDNGEEGQYLAYQALFGKFNMAYRSAIGNHDIFFEGWKNFKKFLGRSMYSFNADNVHITVLDSANGVFGEKQLSWLEEDLKAATQTHKIVLTHYPIWNGNFTSVFKLASEEEAAIVKDMLSRYSVNIMFAGHYHGYNEIELGGVKYIVTGGANDLIDPGNHQNYVEVTVNGNSLDTRKVAFP